MNGEKVKGVLKRFHLLGFANIVLKASRNRETNNRIQDVLDTETAFAFNKVKSLDGQIGSIKIGVHGIEKNLIKGGQNYEVLEKKCCELIQRVSCLLDEYKDYPVDSDIVREVVGITYLMIEESDGKFEPQKALAALSSFQGKHGRIKYHRISLDTKSSNDLNFISAAEYCRFVQTRHSVREMTNGVIPVDEMREIVSTAQICPSACNRQPTKVYYTSESEKIRKLFPDPVVTRDIYNILIVTINKAYYSSSEVLQAWIDGGIFLESMVMALHSHRIGSCIFQCLKNSKRYFEVKKAVGIPENEDIVAFIGYGRLRNAYRVISSHRKEVDEVLIDFSNRGRLG